MVMVQDATFHIKMQIYCFTLQEQNDVYLSVISDLWPYKIQQIRLLPELRPGPRGELTTLPRPLVGWEGGVGRGHPRSRLHPPRCLDPRAVTNSA